MYLPIDKTFLPEYKSCTLSFLQDILTDEKLSLDADQVKTRPIKKQYEEFCVKNVWPLCKKSKILNDYLPVEEMEKGRYPNRDFFWGIAFTVVP